MLASAALGRHESAERRGAKSIAHVRANCPFAAFLTQMLGGGTIDAEIGKAKHLPLRRCRVGTTKETAYGCYVIADMKITNPNQFPEFIEVTPATVQRYGGKYLVRGGAR